MLIGYAITAAIAVSFIWLIASALIARKDIKKIFSGKSLLALLALVLIVLFFVSFSLLYVHPTEQLYFDENIYQGIAINILHNGNSLWCQYGTGNLQACPLGDIYHDPAGISFFVAIAFAALGTGIGTAYGLELLVGVISIVLVFMLSSLLMKDSKGVVASTLIFSLMPELFIWSRAQAVPNLYFMAFTILAFTAFVMFIKRKSAATLSIMLSATALASFMRIEGILLVPIFIIAYFFYEKGNYLKKVSAILNAFNSNLYVVIAIFLFLLIMLPQAYYLSYEFANPQYGQGSSGLFSIASFKANVLGSGLFGQPACSIYGVSLGPNVCFFLGKYNTTGFYPTIFPELITLLAVLGLIAIIIGYRHDIEARGILLLTLMWIIAYYLFYGFFYAGSALYGVDVRFMLELLPPISILAGVAVAWLSSIPYWKSGHEKKYKRKPGISSKQIASVGIFVAVLAITVLYPFYTYIPIVTISPQNMPQQSVILNAMNFFYANYSKVPTNCLVFTYTPDIWYEVNRSAAQIGYLGSTDAQFSNFSSGYKCVVYDFGYWCNVPPGQQSCPAQLKGYETKDLASENITINGQAQRYGFYQLLNYT